MNHDKESLTPQAQILELRVVFLEDDKDDPSLSILIDGRSVFETSHTAGFIGFYPDGMLADGGALSVPSSPRRVALYRCSCGEPGCGVVAPRVSVEEGVVQWSDFRDYTGVFDDPTLDPETESMYLGPDGGHLLPIGDMVFDRVQYESEVERARLDRTWESPARETARLVEAALHADRESFERNGRRIGWVSYPWWSATRSGWLIETRRQFSDDHVRSSWDHIEQRIAEVRTEPASPPEQAADILRQLRAVSIDQWPSVYPSSI